MIEDEDKGLLNKVADAIYDSTADTVIKRVNTLSIPLDHVRNTFEEAYQANDRACAIVIFALIDQMVTEIFSQHIIHPNNQFQGKILGENGILSTASSRILMAYALAWLLLNVFHDVTLVRKIRNRFAHKMEVRNFSDRDILGFMNSFKLNPYAGAEKAILVLTESGELPKDALETFKEEYDKKGKFFFCITIIFLSQELLSQLTVAPIALKMSVNPSDILKQWHDSGALKSIRMEFTRAFIFLLEKLLEREIARESENS